MGTTTDSIIDEIIRVEGDAYTDDPTDAGGPTKFGITQKTLSAYRGKPVTPMDVQNLTRSEAFNIYKDMYVNDPRFNLIEEVSPAIAAEVVDTGVNTGTGTAAKMLQRALNALNNKGEWAELVVDGAIGRMSINALSTFLKVRGKAGEFVLLSVLNSLQATRYVELTEAKTSQRKYFYGWVDHRVAQQLRTYVKANT